MKLDLMNRLRRACEARNVLELSFQKSFVFLVNLRNLLDFGNPIKIKESQSNGGLET